jgi:predicted RNA binding protein YcfA (HicA-like mRNA interferase family)
MDVSKGMNKQLTQQNLLELQKQTLINILSSKGIIYTHYKNKQKGNHVRYRLSQSKN